MAKPLAFEVAVCGNDPAPIGFYDSDLQQFVWEADGEVSLGSPLCTTSPTSEKCKCSATSTACSYGASCPLGQSGYVCDYG
jgi:hypothetical protein